MISISIPDSIGGLDMKKSLAYNSANKLVGEK